MLPAALPSAPASNEGLSLCYFRADKVLSMPLSTSILLLRLDDSTTSSTATASSGFESSASFADAKAAVVELAPVAPSFGGGPSVV
jgi:hypothetical protein